MNTHATYITIILGILVAWAIVDVKLLTWLKRYRRLWIEMGRRREMMETDRNEWMETAAQQLDMLAIRKREVAGLKKLVAHQAEVIDKLSNPPADIQAAVIEKLT